MKRMVWSYEMESKILKIRVKGDMACFSRPEMKIERYSYEVITPSAARGIIESIYWKPEIKWEIVGIKVMNELPRPRINMRRNEIKSISNSPIIVEDDRTQRNCSIIKDVDYVIYAKFRPSDSINCTSGFMNKHEAIFERRIGNNQAHRQPYFGCREFPAYVSGIVEENINVDNNMDLGIMFYDFQYEKTYVKPRFFKACVLNNMIDTSRSLILGSEK